MIVTDAVVTGTDLVPTGEINSHLGWANSVIVPARVVIGAYDRVCGPRSVFGYCWRKHEIQAVAYQWPFDNLFRLHPPVQSDTVTFEVDGTDYDAKVAQATGEAFLACPDGYEAGTPINVSYVSGEEETGVALVPPAEVQTAVLMAAEALILDPANPVASDRAIRFQLRNYNRQGWL